MNEPPESKPMEACTRLSIAQLMAAIRIAYRNAPQGESTIIVPIYDGHTLEKLELVRNDDPGTDGWTLAHPVLLMP